MILRTHRDGFVARQDTASSSQVSRLMKSLADCGYEIYKIDPSRQRHRHNMMVVHRQLLGDAMWLYERDDGRVVVRPWNDKWALDHLRARLAANRKGSFPFVLGRRLEPGKNGAASWKSWLSPASRREAELLGW